MKFSMQWLIKEMETTASPKAIADALTKVGLEVESVTDPAETLKDFVVAYVKEAKPHPNADRLKVCQVDNGQETVEVVCGAPNARTGMKGVFAKDGSFIPGTGITLKKSKIRGVTSNGMLLSVREMGLGDDHAGIVELPDSAEVGSPAAAAMGLNDPVFDISVTPNRADCLGVRGIARDLAAVGIGTLKPMGIKTVPGKFPSPIKVHLDFDATTKNACPYFVGRYFRGVKNKPSPAWLADKLKVVGLRPISALVDITNLIMLAYNRPLHVFDADKLTGDIHARLSRSGETILALDGKSYALDDQVTVIADDKVPQGLGGVMGGEESGVTGDTVNVFLETAYFDPVRTAMTGRKLGIISDARYRFERGVDPAFLIDATELASGLILGLCGGEASEIVVAGAEPHWQRSYPLRHARVKALGGVEVAKERVEEILGKLGFTPTPNTDGWSVEVPSWRHDVVGEADLVEEVIRIVGFDKIPTTSLPKIAPLPSGAVTLAQERRSRARRVLAARGLTEAVTFSFLPAKHAELFGTHAASLHLANPISADLDVMRPSLLPNLVAAAQRNAARGIGDAALFEVGPQYKDETPTGQATAASGIRTGAATPRGWTGPARKVDVFDAKADVLDLLAQLGAPVASAQTDASAPAWYHPGRSGTLRLGPQVLAHFGELHPRVVKAMDADGPVAAFEIFLDAIPLPKAGRGTAKPKLELNPLQPVSRDFAFVVAREVTAEAVARAAAAADKALIVDARVFDVFEGKDIPAGKKSIAVEVLLQPKEATLTDTEIEAVAQKIVANVAKQTGGTLRS
jgi:phenylalanyl-tRNA synthetase beta chain